MRSAASEQARAIYLARVGRRAAADHPYDWCFDPVAAIHPAPTISLPRALCVEPWSIPTDLPEDQGPAAAWVITMGHGDTPEHVYAAQHCGATPEVCGALARESMVDLIRCWQIDKVWAEVPDSSRRCAGDEHCTMFLAAGDCFRRSLSALVSGPYQELLERFGPPCGYSIMGACPGGDFRPRCLDGCCTVEDRNAPTPTGPTPSATPTSQPEAAGSP